MTTTVTCHSCKGRVDLRTSRCACGTTPEGRPGDAATLGDLRMMTADLPDDTPLRMVCPDPSRDDDFLVCDGVDVTVDRPDAQPVVELHSDGHWRDA